MDHLHVNVFFFDKALNMKKNIKKLKAKFNIPGRFLKIYHLYNSMKLTMCILINVKYQESILLKNTLNYAKRHLNVLFFSLMSSLMRAEDCKSISTSREFCWNKNYLHAVSFALILEDVIMMPHNCLFKTQVILLQRNFIIQKFIFFSVWYALGWYYHYR